MVPALFPLLDYRFCVSFMILYVSPAYICVSFVIFYVLVAAFCVSPHNFCASEKYSKIPHPD
jgi:hypothetical protein